MTRKKIFVIIGIVSVLLFSTCLNFSMIVKYKQCNESITKLSKSIESLSNKLELLEELQKQSQHYYQYDLEYGKSSYNYLALGNSLTLIPGVDRGIFSSKPDNDYFNLVVKYLQQQHKKVVAYPVNVAYWERAEDRKSTLKALDIWLDKNLNLVTIQLGENCSNVSTYKQDLIYLVNYIKGKCPNAKIIIIGDFWSEERNQLRLDAAKYENVQFADLSPIINDKKYQSHEGAVFYLKNGKTDKVPKIGETHPNDKGFEYIANNIIKKL